MYKAVYVNRETRTVKSILINATSFNEAMGRFNEYFETQTFGDYFDGKPKYELIALNPYRAQII